MVQKGLFLKLKFSVFFLPKLKNTVFVIHVVAFDPIKIQTCSALQNDHLNLSFVKDINVACEKMTRNGPKMAKRKGCLF